MDLYGQDAELQLLNRLVDSLSSRILLDVGAERGALAEAMLGAGIEEAHLLEPHPDNVEALRRRFAEDERVRIKEYGVSSRDGEGELHVSTDPAGEPISFGHTLLTRPDTQEISWPDTIGVRLRSLESLLDAGELPRRVGILKVDTEGHDLEVIQGMGILEADIVMVEHWTDLPNGLGACPWKAEDVSRVLGARGFHHFAFIVHRGEFTTLKWDDGEVEPGAMGNLVFVHDSALERAMPKLLECAGWLAEQAVAVGQRYVDAAAKRSSIIAGLEHTAEERLTLVRRIHDEAESRLQTLNAVTEQLRERSAELDALRLHRGRQRN